MALVTCPECGREVSDKAEMCPGCGCPMHELQRVEVGSLYDYFSENGLWEEYRDWVISRQNEEFCQGKWQKEPAENIEWVLAGAFDRVADEVFWKQPLSVWKNENAFCGRSILSRKMANAMMEIRADYWKEKKKNGKIPDAIFCPSCGGHETEMCEEFRDKGGGVMQKLKVKKCLACGKTWEPSREN